MSKTCFMKWLILAAAVTLTGANAAARATHQKIYDEDPLSKPEYHKKCAICHEDEEDRAKLNELGKAFRKAEYEITPEIRQKFPTYFLPEAEKKAEEAGKPEEPEVMERRSGPFVPEDLPEDSETPTKEAREKAARSLPENPALGREIAAAAQDVAAKPQKRIAAQPDDKKKPKPKIYRQPDVRLINLPTAIPMPKGSLWNDYTHRWPNGDTTSAETLYGLDSRAVPSFGFMYGVTDRIHVGAYRSSSDLGRPIQIFAGMGLLNEQKGQPLSLMARVGIEGRDNFKRNFATSIELAAARSITRHAQIYVVPTVTFGDRPYNVDPTENAPGVTAYALGLGGAVNIRPTVSLMAEVNYRLNKEARYADPDSGNGIRRPVIGFGIQKMGASRRHIYGLTFTNGGGTTMSQRSMTRGLQGADDTFRGLTIGFNLTRRIF